MPKKTRKYSTKGKLTTSEEGKREYNKKLMRDIRARKGREREAAREHIKKLPRPQLVEFLEKHSEVASYILGKRELKGIYENIDHRRPQKKRRSR